MTVPTSIAAYDDCADLFDRALRSPNGIRAEVASAGDAYQLRVRLHYFRKFLRERSMMQYPADDPNHGVSGYDNLIVRMPEESDGKWWVRIDKKGIILGVEELGAAE